MIRIRVPATSANLGPGFDVLGIAWNLYNQFDVEPAASYQLDNVDPAFAGKDNLFLQAYEKACQRIGVQQPIHVTFTCEIPISRGLGSSASLIVGGILAAALLHPNHLTKDQLLEMATEMEGHPDNVAPCLLGGCTACSYENSQVLYTKIPVSKKWIFHVFIPDTAVSTHEARKVLPSSYERAVAVTNTAHAVLMTQALKEDDLSFLQKVCVDAFHEPYRAPLIPHFKEVKEIVSTIPAVFLISGSGSTCLSISQKPLSPNIQDSLKTIVPSWTIQSVVCDENGAQQEKENSLWQTII